MVLIVNCFFLVILIIVSFSFSGGYGYVFVFMAIVVDVLELIVKVFNYLDKI